MQATPIKQLCFCSCGRLEQGILRVLTSIYRSIQGLRRAHVSSPPVAKMKMNTTASSFRESRSIRKIIGSVTVPRESTSLEDHIVDPSHHATGTIAAGDVFQENYFRHKETLTKTRRKNILLLGVLANWQLIIQTELAIAIVAAQRAVCLCAPRDCIAVFGVRVYLML